MNFYHILNIKMTSWSVLVVNGADLTLISCTKNSSGTFFITRGGIDVSATFIGLEMIRDLYTYTLIYHRNILSIIICIELTYMKEMLKAPKGSLILNSRTV